MIRVALYARYSSDNQSVSSIEDQFRICRGTGVVNNEFYAGVLVWNRLRYIKNPVTGKRVSWLNVGYQMVPVGLHSHDSPSKLRNAPLAREITGVWCRSACRSDD